MSLSIQADAAAALSSSLATGQRTIHAHDLTYSLLPPLTAGCPRTSNADISYPLEVSYDYAAVGSELRQALFDRRHLPDDILSWAPLLPPLDSRLGLGIGGTPLVDVSAAFRSNAPVLVKDESRNPTWSHKDRLNLCTVSAAALSGAPGVVVASSGNHGASAAALSARVGLPCIVVMSPGAPALAESFVGAYGATVLSVPRDARWGVVKDIVDKLGFHPVSNQTTTHTGHPFGPEGYKTIAYELYIQLGHRLPGAVFVPTGYGELLYGVWKGFEELRLLGVVDSVPSLYACEIGSRAVLATALAQHRPAVTVDFTPTDAYSLATTTGGYRSTHVMNHTTGRVIGVDDPDLVRAQDDLSGQGIWQELSGVASVAGLRTALQQGDTFDGPIVCVCTSTGLKDKNALRYEAIESAPDWDTLSDLLRRQGLTVA
ncbi:threonine synthase [Kribbella orskensis]|uniref:Threonine synthase n=1 Tax=Kribbella orskensis TaxID=2512216 RepID=A0ABY2BKU6_9ACTN|nr:MULTISPECIES: pyridoxal-phosphate dependent enzyme [Kribbella]TCN40752.1 threonine synthase [Kribbella sp. VKM Ac-2500]TCO24004.1 threonine synthase [Kribbella orskensis]